MNANGKILLSRKQLEDALDLDGSVQVVGFDTHRDPEMLTIFLYSQRFEMLRIVEDYDQMELPVIPKSEVLP